MLTEHKNAGSEALTCRLDEDDYDRLAEEIDIAGLDAERIRGDVDELKAEHAARKRDLEAKQAEVFDKIRTRNTGSETRSVRFDEIHDHDRQLVFYRRQDTGAIYRQRNMTELECQSAPGQLDINGEPQQAPPQDLEEVTELIQGYLDAHPLELVDEAEGEEPDESAGPENIDLQEPDEE